MITDRTIELDSKTAAALAAFSRCLQSEPEVAAAWLFGSRASGRARSDSDVDVAILLATKNDAAARCERQAGLETQLSALADCPVRVLVLNSARPTLQHEVFSTGRLFHVRDHEARFEFEVRAGKTNADLAPMRAMFQEALRRELTEGGFGAP
jgi:predicted nucleotidyltransferase